MKALVLYGPGDFRLEEDWPKPKLKKGWALVRVRYSGICGSDLPRMLITGAYHHPLICGHEFMGRIEEPAPGSDRFKVGEKVAALPLIPCKSCSACQEQEYFHCQSYNFLGSRTDGGFAEYCLVPEENLFRLPEDMDERFGAFIEPISVALHLVWQSGFSKGRGLVFGAGAIGILTAMWLKIFGAEKVVLADLRRESLEIASKAGIEDIVNPQDKEFKTHGDFDACFEAAGSNAALISSLEKVSRKGVVTVVGRDTKDTIIPHKMFESFMRKELTIKGTWGYNNVGEDEFIYRMLKEGRFNLKPLITREIPLSEGERIIRQMHSKEIFFCKVLFKI